MNILKNKKNWNEIVKLKPKEILEKSGLEIFDVNGL